MNNDEYVFKKCSIRSKMSKLELKCEEYKSKMNKIALISLNCKFQVDYGEG